MGNLLQDGKIDGKNGSTDQYNGYEEGEDYYYRHYVEMATGAFVNCQAKINKNSHIKLSSYSQVKE